MENQETNKYIKKIIKKRKQDKKKANVKWIATITVLAFTISFFFSFLSEKLMPNVNIYIGIMIVLLFILIGIVFDMIGIAITSSQEAPFHSMSAKKISGADLAVFLKKKAPQMSSFCNDVIGDICGIISGTAGIYVATKLSVLISVDLFTMSLLITALIAALTIGGKAIGKGIAINNATSILYKFSKFLSFFKFQK